MIISQLEIISQNGLQGQPEKLRCWRRNSEKMPCAMFFSRDFQGLFNDFFLKEIETRSEQEIFFQIDWLSKVCKVIAKKGAKLGYPVTFSKPKNRGGLLFYTLGKSTFSFTNGRGLLRSLFSNVTYLQNKAWYLGYSTLKNSHFLIEKIW